MDLRLLLILLDESWAWYFCHLQWHKGTRIYTARSTMSHGLVQPPLKLSQKHRFDAHTGVAWLQVCVCIRIIFVSPPPSGELFYLF